MIKSIQTKFDGRFFRSRLEARWAVFFKYLAIEYAYEPEGYILPDGSQYLIDFLLPEVYYRSQLNQGWFIEVKPFGTYNEKLDLLCAETGIPGLLLSGHNVKANGHLEFGTYRDDNLGFRKCLECQAIKISYGHQQPTCPVCGNYTCDKLVLEAVNAANSARFER